MELEQKHDCWYDVNTLYSLGFLDIYQKKIILFEKENEFNIHIHLYNHYALLKSNHIQCLQNYN